MYIYIFLSVMYIVCVFLFQPRAPVDSRLAIRYLIGLPWVFLNFYFLNKGDYYYYYRRQLLRKLEVLYDLPSAQGSGSTRQYIVCFPLVSDSVRCTCMPLVEHHGRHLFV